MIKKFIRKLLGRGDAASDAATDAAAATSAVATTPLGQRIEVGRDVHHIDDKLIDHQADKVVRTLQQAGFQAYIVGGAVRDLLLGHRPKDFDVATNATPEQVKSLFRRAFIIGRRFRLVHVVYGRGREHEKIEVSTFRAHLDNNVAEQLGANNKGSRSELAGKSHVVDAAGRVLRDNVWGPQDEDAARRDFTVNALYYDPVRAVVVDYHHGIADAKKRLLRMIGDPTTRYREDPVRLIRAVRFAAKLGFEIEPGTRKPMKQCAELLANVPVSRMFDEMIKLLQTGHALASLEELEKQGLHRGIFPLLDAVLEDAHRHDGQDQFIRRALADTDRRVTEGLPVAPSFMLACMLWHEVQSRWTRLREDQSASPALQDAIDAVFDARIGDISGRGKLAADMREVWMMQTRFERRTAASCASLLEQARYRAGYDFLRLRAEAGEVEVALADWWDDYARADDDLRHEMLETLRRSGAAAPKRVRGGNGNGNTLGRDGAPARTGADSGASLARLPDPGAEDADRGDRDDRDESGGDASPAAGDAPARKRRRRRRKPVDGGEGSAASGSGDDNPGGGDQNGGPARS
jgi:poly(A) polymerase